LPRSSGAASSWRVGVEGRCCRQRQDVAGSGVDDDHGPALCAELLHGLGEHPLGDVLDVAVDRELDVRTRHRLLRRSLRGRNRSPARRALVGPPPVDAGEDLLAGILHARHARAFGADEAHHVRRDVAGGVHTLGRPLAEDSNEAQLLDLSPRLRRLALRDIDEPALAGETFCEDVGIGRQDRSQRLSGRAGILDQGLVRGDVPGLEGLSKRNSPRVGDLPAIGQDLDCDRALVDGGRRELISAQALQIYEAHGEGEENEGRDDEQDSRASTGVAQSDRARRPRRRRPAEGRTSRRCRGGATRPTRRRPGARPSRRCRRAHGMAPSAGCSPAASPGPISG